MIIIINSITIATIITNNIIITMIIITTIVMIIAIIIIIVMVTTVESKTYRDILYVQYYSMKPEYLMYYNYMFSNLSLKISLFLHLNNKNRHAETVSTLFLKTNVKQSALYSIYNTMRICNAQAQRCQ